MKTNGAAAIFQVSDLNKAIRFYIDTLGFTENFLYGGYYAVLAHGEIQLHLSSLTPGKPVGAGSVYIMCDEVDDHYHDIVARGAKPFAEPKDLGYGMRDFMLEDLDGNTLSFGVEIVEAS